MFLAAGEAGAIELMGFDGEIKVFAPTIRGQIIGEPKTCRKEAESHARHRLGPLQARALLYGTRLDEHALGIDGWNGKSHGQAKEEQLQLGQIIHLGSVLAQYEDRLDRELERTLTGITGQNRVQLEHHLPLWLLDPEEEDPETGSKAFLEACARDQSYGLLVEAITPVPQVFLDDYKVSVGDWSYTARYWFYDETIERIWEQARAWRVAYMDRKRQEAMQ
ncbi:hypothetical protein GZ77_07310 [Endozoicomonas montiporae]|uniref:Uncharacterized protein n=3 Tax=Endozoicomonas montiporae TaxID=1027273 RepID=A0A081N701_9GAMM|nr:hypothetical protein EZMO1_1825 [Endozoicomonas montiporae CL-33]KEQ14224.1 hypothetical protein GZ77_07310 [Endozoicomonas montiporae]